MGARELDRRQHLQSARHYCIAGGYVHAGIYARAQARSNRRGPGNRKRRRWLLCGGLQSSTQRIAGIRATVSRAGAGRLVERRIRSQLTMDGPKTVTATFAGAQTGIRFEANVGVPFSVAGSGCPGGTYTAPATVTWTNGVNCTVTVLPPDLGADTRWTFSKWADGPTGAARVITASPGAVYTIVIAVEYRLTRSISGSGSISGSDGWYAAGSTLPLTASPTPGHQFTGWSGAGSGTANPLSVVMNGPKTVIANFTPVASGVRIETNLAVVFYVGGSGCPAGAYNAPITLTWTTGVACEISVQQPAAGQDTRWLFLRWADGPTSNPRILTASPGAVYTIVMSPEYRLTRLVSGGGSVSGADGFYASGTTVSLTATPNSGQQLAAWSGSASGTANPLSVVMDGSKDNHRYLCGSADSSTDRIEYIGAD